RAGCISVCIGGGTTGIVLYRNGRAFRVMSIPIGGDHIKSDLATVLHMSLGEAEYLKKRIFTTSEEDLRREGIDVDLAYQTVLARIEELFADHLRTALSECTPQNFPSGIILSGGVSETPGIEGILHDILMMPVRNVVKPVYDMPQVLANSAYVSSAGILRYYVTRERDPYAFIDSDQELPGLLERSGTPKVSSDSELAASSDASDEFESEGDEYEDEDSYEEQYSRGRANRENFGQVVRTIADSIKRLF
ncbi:MAG: cell division FtsA domain-containing protein, partial [Synergistaceae bacterium]|nr:cell division FtsA domain-containing protein [Synergistaceae bacterium]